MILWYVSPLIYRICEDRGRSVLSLISPLHSEHDTAGNKVRNVWINPAECWLHRCAQKTNNSFLSLPLVALGPSNLSLSPGVENEFIYPSQAAESPGLNEIPDSPAVPWELWDTGELVPGVLEPGKQRRLLCLTFSLCLRSYFWHWFIPHQDPNGISPERCWVPDARGAQQCFPKQQVPLGLPGLGCKSSYSCLLLSEPPLCPLFLLSICLSTERLQCTIHSSKHFTWLI